MFSRLVSNGQPETPAVTAQKTNSASPITAKISSGSSVKAHSELGRSVGNVSKRLFDTCSVRVCCLPEQTWITVRGISSWYIDFETVSDRKAINLLVQAGRRQVNARRNAALSDRDAKVVISEGIMQEDP